jgi:hypothetical protein
MSQEDIDIEENPYELSINFIMGYTEKTKLCDTATYENLKGMLVNFLTIQEEVTDLKEQIEFIDEELTVVFKENKDYISKDDMCQAEGTPDEKIGLLKNLLSKLVIKADLKNKMASGGLRRGSISLNAELADNVEYLEKKVLDLTEELEHFKSAYEKLKIHSDET